MSVLCKLFQVYYASQWLVDLVQFHSQLISEVAMTTISHFYFCTILFADHWCSILLVVNDELLF